MNEPQERPPLPPGSAHVANWAKTHGLIYAQYPDESWFRQWEPNDTFVSASAFFNSVSWPIPGGTGTIAEPWYAEPGSEPLDRAVLLFFTHTGFTRRAAARGGEHFNTRVAFLENPPPPRVEIGDPVWDAAMATFAASAAEAAAAFPPAVRAKLGKWGFTGHFEVRPGGLVMHWAGVKPTPTELDRLRSSGPRLLAAFFDPQ